MEEAKRFLDLMDVKKSDQAWTLLAKSLRHAINNKRQETLESVTEQLVKAAEMDHVTAWWLAEVYALIEEKDKAEGEEIWADRRSLRIPDRTHRQAP